MPFLTPVEPDGYCVVLVPIPRSLGFTSSVLGALTELTKSYNWEEFGDVSIEDTVQIMLQMMLDLSIECGVPIIDERGAILVDENGKWLVDESE